MLRHARRLAVGRLLLAGGLLAGPLSYTATEIGSLGGSMTTGTAIHASGPVVGSSDLPGENDILVLCLQPPLEF